MSLIICNENCRHKQDGYCALNHISSLTADSTAKCGYFEAVKSSVPQQVARHDPLSYTVLSTDKK